MAFHVENNESKLFGVTKQEYLRVLTSIVNNSDTVQARPQTCLRIGATTVTYFTPRGTEIGYLEFKESAEVLSSGQKRLHGGA